MIIPELPFFLASLGGAKLIGLNIALFTVTALLSRPFSGKLADRIGRKPIIMAGSLVCFVCGMLYPSMTTVVGFLFLRLMHGFSTGFTPTGQTAYISDIVPADRRGEAMGLLGTASTLGMAGGPALGGWLSTLFSLDVMFYCSSAFALLSSLIIFSIKETVKEKHPVSFKLLKIEKRDLFEPRVLAPCLVMGLCAYAYGNLYTIMPGFGSLLGIENKGLLFTYFTVASFLVRLVAGRASDRMGRVKVLRISTALMALSMVWIAVAETKLWLIIGAAVYGLAQGATSPTLLAWAVDLSHPEYKGRGVSSLYIFMEFGIGVGAFASGLIYADNAPMIMVTFLISSALSAIAFLYLVSVQRKVVEPGHTPSPSPSPEEM